MLNAKIWMDVLTSLTGEPLSEVEKLQYESKRRKVAVRHALLYLHQWLRQWGKDHPDPMRPDELPGAGIGGTLDLYFEAGPDWIEMRDLYSAGKDGFLRLSWDEDTYTYEVSEKWQAQAKKRGHQNVIDWVYTWLCEPL